MGSSELKTFSLSASFVEAYNRTGSGVCLHVCLHVCLCSDRWFVELPPIIVWVVVPSREAEFLPSTHRLFASVTKKQKNCSGEEITSLSLFFSFLTFLMRPTPQTVRGVHLGAVPHSSAPGLV